MGATDAKDLLDRGVQAARQAGFEVTGLLVETEHKRISEIIAATAEEHDALMIVMGQGRSSPLGKPMVGPVTREVLGSSQRPVILVGAGSAEVDA
jgi:nucleotide-binding universal stress UspA family protein